MQEGYYSIEYVGAYGRGRALLALNHGKITGVDVGDVKYQGMYSYNPRTDLIDFELTLTVPPGTQLVPDGRIRAREEAIVIKESMPRDGTDTSLPINTPIGPVNVLLRRISDLPE